MSLPWMPLHIADYRLDTARLNAIEHGAYLLLIMEYWAAGSLPDDDRLLARITCTTDREWKAVKPAVQRFFHAGWKHKRIDDELAKAADKISKRTSAANEMHRKRRANADAKARANADASAPVLHDIRAVPQPPKDSEANASGAEAPLTLDPSIPRRELFERGKAVLGEKAGGQITRLLAAKGGNVALARAAIEQASQAQDAAEYVGRIVSTKPNGSPANEASVIAAGRRLIERAEAAERGMLAELRSGSGDENVRLLAQDRCG